MTAAAPKNLLLADRESAQFLWFISILAAVGHYLLCTLLTSAIALDMDTVNLVYAIDTFDISRLSPHPPGYLPYVLLLRGIHAILPVAPLTAVQLTARLFSTAAVLAIPFVVRNLLPENQTAPRFAALLAALHPFLIFHGTDGQTHASEGFAATLLLLCLVRPKAHTNINIGILKIGLLLAVGVALRPSFILMGLGPIIWTFRKKPKALFVVASVTVAATACWIVPTIMLSGGLGNWAPAHKAFIVDGFVMNGASFALTARRTLIWTALLILPILPGLIQKRSIPSGLKALTLTAAVPAILFFLLTFVSEPGYFQGLVPYAIAWTAALAATCPRPRLTGVLAVAAQVCILLLPEGGKIGMKTPSIPEIINREVAGEVELNDITAPLTKTMSALYITDYPGSALQRQLPKLRPHTDVLSLYRFDPTGFEITSMSFSTYRTLIPIPGPVLHTPGSQIRFDTKTAYDKIILAPFLSADLRRDLKKESHCKIPDRESNGVVVHLNADCFPSGILRLGKNSITFKPK